MMKQVFCLHGQYIALCDLLKCCGIAPSGGAAKNMVVCGLVQVDSQVERRKSCKIRGGQQVSGEGFMINVRMSNG